MGLIKCPECGKNVSDTCKQCIHCGYNLTGLGSGASIDVPVEKTESSLTVFLKKYKVFLGIAIVLIIGVIIALFVFSKSEVNIDVFDELSVGQTRENVREAYGEPDDISNEDSSDEYSWNIDDYNMEFLGTDGELSVWYDSENKVTHAFFSYTYSDRLTGSQDPVERTAAEEYFEVVLAYYTEIYGEPKSDFYDWEWERSDGTSVALSFDLDSTIGCPVRIIWC